MASRAKETLLPNSEPSLLGSRLDKLHRPTDQRGILTNMEVDSVEVAFWSIEPDELQEHPFWVSHAQKWLQVIP